jgi:hypothetical protein
LNNSGTILELSQNILKHIVSVLKGEGGEPDKYNDLSLDVWLTIIEINKVTIDFLLRNNPITFESLNSYDIDI